MYTLENTVAKGLREIGGKRIDFIKLTKNLRILDTGAKYGEVGGQWQYEIDEAIATHQRVYLQLARGHDKTDRFAWWSLLWLNSTFASRGYCAGVDRDNAALFRDSSKKLKAIHPELFYAIDVQKDVVLNKETGSWIETISSDADSAYGLNFDLLIVNDLHAHPDEKFWEVLWTACGKKPGIRVWVESNALTLGSEGAVWVAKLRKWVKEKGTVLPPDDGKWWFFCPRGFLADWQKPQIEQWKETLHPSAFRRLINNEDTSGEESYLTVEQVEAVTREYRKDVDGLDPEKKDTFKKTGYVVTAVDLGLKKDATAICTVQSLPVIRGTAPKYRLLALDVVSGSLSDPVQLRVVEEIIHEHRNKYKSSPVLIDPWNAASLTQKYSWITEWPFTTAHVRELTHALYQAVNNGHLSIFPQAGKARQSDGEDWDLQRELINAVVKDTSYGQRVDHKAGGYSDRLMALGMCIHYFCSPEFNIPRVVLPLAGASPLDDWQGGKLMDSWNNEGGSKLLKL